MSERLYSFQCNRCDTGGTDSSRAGIELFTEHHIATVHPLFTAKAATELVRPESPKSRKRRPLRSARLTLAVQR